MAQTADERMSGLTLSTHSTNQQEASMKHSPDNIPLLQPLIELLGSAEKFGSDFNRPGDVEHLKETLANVRSLKDRALSNVRGISELMESIEANGLTPHGA